MRTPKTGRKQLTCRSPPPLSFNATPSLPPSRRCSFLVPAGSEQPKTYKVRLYVLQALNLTPMDVGVGGRPGKSDPYLRVRLGKEVCACVRVCVCYLLFVSVARANLISG